MNRRNFFHRTLGSLLGVVAVPLLPLLGRPSVPKVYGPSPLWPYYNARTLSKKEWLELEVDVEAIRAEVMRAYANGVHAQLLTSGIIFTPENPKDEVSS